MDIALIVITLLSVALTGALLIYAARLQREQRAREEARIAALAHDIHVDSAPDPVPLFRAHVERVAPVSSTIHEMALDPSPTAPSWEEGTSVATRGLFSAETAPGRPARRLAVPAIGAAVVVAAVGLVYLVSAPPAGASRPTASSPVSTSSSLELVALEQTRSGQALTVQGVVRNPDGASPRRGVTAVVFVFDRSGAFVTSARAAIDYQMLEAGDESPFTVAVPGATGAARYRVSFRTESDVLPHLDLRAGPRGGSQGPKG
jgi:hypothetical protein